MDAYDITFKIIYRDGLPLWIHNPVFTYSVILVVVELADVIIGWIVRGSNFNDEIGCSVEPLIIQFILIADNHYVGLNDNQRIIRQFHIEWSIENAAGGFLA